MCKKEEKIEPGYIKKTNLGIEALCSMVDVINEIEEDEVGAKYSECVLDSVDRIIMNKVMRLVREEYS